LVTASRSRGIDRPSIPSTLFLFSSPRSLICTCTVALGRYWYICMTDLLCEKSTVHRRSRQICYERKTR
jgi:hypothetical protein